MMRLRRNARSQLHATRPQERKRRGAAPHSARKASKTNSGRRSTICRFRPRRKAQGLGELYAQLGRPRTQRLRRRSWRPSKILACDRQRHRRPPHQPGCAAYRRCDLALALEILDATVAIAPEEAEAWYLRAKVQYLQRRYELALADLRRALDRDPKHYRALDDLGLVLEALGTKKEALEAYRHALQVNPFLEDARQAVEFLSREVGDRDTLAGPVLRPRWPQPNIAFRVVPTKAMRSCWWRGRSERHTGGDDDALTGSAETFLIGDAAGLATMSSRSRGSSVSTQCKPTPRAELSPGGGDRRQGDDGLLRALAGGAQAGRAGGGVAMMAAR